MVKSYKLKKAQGTAFCEHCYTLLPDTAEFCIECGRRPVTLAHRVRRYYVPVKWMITTSWLTLRILYRFAGILLLYSPLVTLLWFMELKIPLYLVFMVLFVISLKRTIKPSPLDEGKKGRRRFITYPAIVLLWSVPLLTAWHINGSVLLYISLILFAGFSLFRMLKKTFWLVRPRNIGYIYIFVIIFIIGDFLFGHHMEGYTQIEKTIKVIYTHSYQVSRLFFPPHALDMAVDERGGHLFAVFSQLIGKEGRHKGAIVHLLLDNMKKWRVEGHGSFQRCLWDSMTEEFLFGYDADEGIIVLRPGDSSVNPVGIFNGALNNMPVSGKDDKSSPYLRAGRSYGVKRLRLNGVKSLEDMVVDQRRQRLLALSDEGELHVVDWTKPGEIYSFPAGRWSHRIVTDTINQYYYIIRRYPVPAIMQINAENLKEKGKVILGGIPGDILSLPDRYRIVVAFPLDGCVEFYDPDSLKSSARIETDYGVFPMAYDVRRGLLFVGSYIKGTLSVIDTSSYTPIKSLFVGPRISALAIAPVADRLYVGNAHGILEVDINSILE